MSENSQKQWSPEEVAALKAKLVLEYPNVDACTRLMDLRPKLVEEAKRLGFKKPENVSSLVLETFIRQNQR